MREVGRIVELVRYPVKSMAGVKTESAFLGWHGFDGDRRFAFRRVGDESGFPWLTASRLPELLLYEPVALEERGGEQVPTQVRTPNGSYLGLQSPELTAEIAGYLGSNVELMKLKHGIFDEGAVSLISLATIAGIEREVGFDLDRRRFRVNIVIESALDEPFLEDRWLDHRLVFGNFEAGPALSVTLRDERCVMVNLDPNTAKKDTRVMKAVTHLNQNYAGVYATVVRSGTLNVGERVYLVT